MFRNIFVILFFLETSCISFNFSIFCEIIFLKFPSYFMCFTPFNCKHLKVLKTFNLIKILNKNYMWFKIRSGKCYECKNISEIRIRHYFGNLSHNFRSSLIELIICDICSYHQNFLYLVIIIFKYYTFTLKSDYNSLAFIPTY